MKKFSMGWGDTVVVRQALAQNLKGYIPHSSSIVDMAYTNHYGETNLVKNTKEVIKRQTGLTYDHILLTNGATGGIALTLRAYKSSFLNAVITNPPPFYPLYKTIIESLQLKHYVSSNIPSEALNNVFLVDSPSNPLGLINAGLGIIASTTMPIVWDGVYSNAVYAPGCSHPGSIAKVMVGSYSKLLGINGIRLGWVATNDLLLFERLKILADAEYAGLSRPSQEILLSILSHIDWDSFEKSAKFKLDSNRSEWQKLEKFFDGQEVSPIGMFYYGKMNKTAKKLFNSIGIEWVFGSKCGDTDEYGRFNLAQDNNLVAEAVISVLRKDKLK